MFWRFTELRALIKGKQVELAKIVQMLSLYKNFTSVFELLTSSEQKNGRELSLPLSYMMKVPNFTEANEHMQRNLVCEGAIQYIQHIKQGMKLHQN